MNRSIAYIKHTFAVTLTAGLLISGSARANSLNVPGDFPNSFAMNLLGGFIAVDNPRGGGVVDSPFATDAKRILFDASAFDGIGPGAGTSQLTLTSFNHWDIGTASAFGQTANFYIEGPGTGTLVDHAGSTAGDWTLQVPLFATWNGIDFLFSDFTLSTAASYSYYPVGNTTETTINGTAMDYGTGDAYLVGQSDLGFLGGPFTGLRLTVGLHGNDPVVVPVPGALWLFGSGFMGLIGMAGGRRRRHA
ncbi:MAG: hypothetical protein WCC36_12255 [Gammaproteobacteria bacterium]